MTIISFSVHVALTTSNATIRLFCVDMQCVVSFVLRRKKPSRIRSVFVLIKKRFNSDFIERNLKLVDHFLEYFRFNFGLSANIVGLLLLLHKSAYVRNQRFFTRIQGRLPNYPTGPEREKHVDSMYIPK